MCWLSDIADMIRPAMEFAGWTASRRANSLAVTVHKARVSTLCAMGSARDQNHKEAEM
jgi:hypothetical protein